MRKLRYWSLLNLVWIGILLGLLHVAAASIATRYPDRDLTPGAVDESVTVKQLCTPGYTSTVRNVSEVTKKEILKEYGIDPSDSGKYEIDHFISLEIGGLNDKSNLWAQPYCPVGNDPLKSGCWGARDKDKVETALHRWMCAGKIPLKQAQDIIRTDWVACYKQLVAGEVCTN